MRMTRTDRRLARPLAGGVAILGVAALGGCAFPPPDAPSFTALPGKGKTYAAFQQDDNYCRSQAFAASGGNAARENAVGNGVGTAAIGTVLGAGAGALLGAAAGAPGVGAAIGAGTGLALGGAVGAGNADQDVADAQGRYDQVYAQCMVAYGNIVPVPQPPTPVVAYPAYPYPYPYPYAVPYGPPPVVVGPSFGFGAGW